MIFKKLTAYINFILGFYLRVTIKVDCISTSIQGQTYMFTGICVDVRKQIISINYESLERIR